MSACFDAKNYSSRKIIKIKFRKLQKLRLRLRERERIFFRICEYLFLHYAELNEDSGIRETCQSLLRNRGERGYNRAHYGAPPSYTVKRSERIMFAK